MSKVSSPQYPSYSAGSVSIGGSRAKTGMKNGVLSSSYQMSPEESSIYDYALGTLAQILPSVNTFDSKTLSSIQSQVDAYRDSGLGAINEAYNPMIMELQNDIASRFGNLDNSIFAQNLSDIEAERAKSVSSFAQDILAKQSELKSDELTRRYALVELLTGIANNTYDNALSSINAALGNSASANNYNTNVYKALSDISRTNSASRSNSVLANLFSGADNTFGSFFNFL